MAGKRTARKKNRQKQQQQQTRTRVQQQFDAYRADAPSYEEGMNYWAVYWDEGDEYVYGTIMETPCHDEKEALAMLVATVPEIRKHMVFMTLVPSKELEFAQSVLETTCFTGAAWSLMNNVDGPRPGAVVVPWERFVKEAFIMTIRLSPMTDAA